MRRKYLLLTMALVFLPAFGCNDLKTDAINNPGKYLEASKTTYGNVKSTNLDGTNLDKAKSVVDTVGAVVTTVGTTVPGTQGYAGIAIMILTAASGVLEFFRRKEKKKADNYREGIEAGIQYGDDQSNANVHVLKEVLDKNTKEHFNKEGQTKL